jgi:pimeloyl-ACP methyl ester carboxylesterase
MTKRQFSAKIDGVGLSVVVARCRKTPVLLIHGNSSCKEIFRNQFDYLVNLGYGVVAVDLPGHGDSENARMPRSTYSFPGYARLLRSLMHQLEIPKFHIIGWSLGGHIGIEMWHSDPTVRSLLITGTPPVTLSPSGAARGFNDVPSMNLAGARSFSRTDADRYGAAMLGTALDHRLRVVRTIARTDGRARYWMLKNGVSGLGVDQVKAIGSCRRPLAVVQGTDDPFVNSAYVQSLNYTNLWLKRPIMVKAGHAPHWQKPRMFNAYMRKFLDHVE